MYVRKTLRVEDPGMVGVVSRMVEGLCGYSRTWRSGRDRHEQEFQPVVIFFCGRPVVMYRRPVVEVVPEWSAATAEWVQKSRTTWVYYDTMEELFDASGMGQWHRRDISTAWERLSRADGTHVHHAIASPVVVVHPEANRVNLHVEVDPKLKDFSFGRFFGADGCYQEIDQFVGGVLSNNPGIVQVSDRDRLLAHGFDPKWSFRNPAPPTRKRKRRKG